MSLLVTAVGPTIERTWTVPDADVKLLTDHDLVTPAQGGTGFGSYTAGDLLYASGASALSKLASVAAGSVLVSGPGAPAWSANPPLASVNAPLFQSTAASTLTVKAASGQVVELGNADGMCVDIGSSNFSPVSDNTKSLGLSGQRWTQGFFSTSVVTPLVDGPAGATMVVRSVSGQNLSLQAQGASQIQFTVNATNWLSLNNVGTLFPVTDNTNQLGSTSNRWTTAYLSTALFMGTNPATTGEIRLPNNGAGIATRNAANSANYTCLFMDNSNVLYLGDPVTPSIVQLNSTITRFNGATASFPGLKRNNAILAVRLADDSSDAAISAANFQIPTAGTLTATADGVWMLLNAAGTSFGRLMFGGSTASFPALKRDTIFLSLRLADDSGVSGAITASLPAGAAGRDGNIGFDTTLNAFVYYVGGNRYKLVGTSF